MEGGPANPEDHGWEKLLEAQSEYIANLQRMLQSACQNAASLSQSQDTGAAEIAAGRGHPAVTQGAAVIATAASVAEMRPSGGQDSGFLPPQRSQQQPQLQPQQPRVMRMGSQPRALPADEGAGSYAFEKLPMEDVSGAVAVSYIKSSTGPTTAGSSAKGEILSGGAAAGTGVASPGTSGPPPVAGSAEKVEEVANEVLRLRLVKSQHEELRTQLSRAEGKLKRLSPLAVFQLRSYLERNFREPNLAAHVQDALVRLLECLCAVSRIEVASYTPESLLSSVRKLLRDPHSFTTRLCSMPHMTGEEAKGLAPFLLSTTQFKRVRDKEVNECYDAFHA